MGSDAEGSDGGPVVVSPGDAWILSEAFGGTGDYAFDYGVYGDVALVGDWDGDGRDSPGVFRAGVWYLSNSFGGTGDHVFSYGVPGDVPIVGDWDGDGRDSPGVFRNGAWHLSDSFGGTGDYVFDYGAAGDVPVVGDWNGDGRDGPGVFRGGAWYLSNVFGGAGEYVFDYGVPGDVPIAGDWDGDGRDGPGVFRAGAWFLSNGFGGDSDNIFDYGIAGDQPVVGDWNGDGSDRPGVVRYSALCPDLRASLESTPGTPWRTGGGAGYPDMVDPASACTTVVSTRDELMSALAVARPGTAVYIADSADIDLTGVSVGVPNFVTLASGRGRGGSQGAVLRSATANPNGMIVLGEGNRVTGLRIIGHNETTVTECAEGWTSHCDYSRGIRTGLNSEVDNNELRGHVLSAVAVSRTGVHVHHNSITHNQREHLGYGVALEDVTGPEAIIEFNYFDYNRHSVMGSGHRGQKYWVRYNYVGGHATAHAFDVHHAPLEGAEGTVAGTHLEVYGNIVMVPDNSTFRVRGRPTEGAWVYGNCIGRGRYRASLPAHAQDVFAQVGTLGNFWIDTDPAGNVIPNRYGQTAASCGPL